MSFDASTKISANFNRLITFSRSIYT